MWPRTIYSSTEDIVRLKGILQLNILTFLPPIAMSHTAHTHCRAMQLILENKFSMTTEAYTENNMLDPEFASGLAWHFRDGKVNYVLNVMMGYDLVFFLRKGQNFLIVCKNIPADKLLSAVYDLWFSCKSHD